MKSQKGIAQDDLIAMGTYAFRATPLIHFLHELVLTNEEGVKEVSFADKFTVTRIVTIS